MASNEEYLKHLNVSQEQDDEGKTASISAVLVTASTNPAALPEIYKALIRLGYESLLDPLVAIPALLPIPDSPSAKDILSLATECCSAKEAIIAIQESVEHIRSRLSDENDEEDEEAEDRLSPTDRLITLTALYSSAISRLKLRKKTAPETLRPLLSDLESTIQLIPRHEILASGRDLITAISLAIQKISVWVNTHSANPGEVKECQGVLHSLLETTTVTCIPSINSSLAQRTFEALYPRMRMPSRSTAPENEESDEAMQRATETLKYVGSSLEKLPTQPSIFSIIILGHNPPSLPPTFTSTTWLESFFPALITCIQSNIALDETLAVLYNQLSSSPSDADAGVLPPEIVTPLTTILAPLASAHPHPQTRFLTFRLLALLLKRSSPLIRLETLKELSGSENEWAQMRVASVGLIKEGILEGLEGLPHDSLATRHCMEIFEKILFCPNPPSFFSELEKGNADEESAASELARISECLALLYVLLLRDKNNRTGIRDPTRIVNIHRSLLGPLRTFMSSQPQDTRIDSVFASLVMNLERVEGAFNDLQLDPTL